MAYEDKIIVCCDCSTEFTHTAEDQERYAERGFTNDPKRCRECRKNRKARQERQQSQRQRGDQRRGPPRSRHGGGGGGGGGGQRQRYPAVCSQCGVTTTVPFKPVEGRPVYCRDCYQAQRG